MKSPEPCGLQAGFTLLEVLIAITLTAMVLGSLFALQSQNYQLQFKSMEKIDQQIQLRSMLNAAWLGLDDELTEEFKVTEKRIEENEELKEKKIKSAWQIESFDLSDKSGDKYFSTSRLIEKKK